MAIFFRGDPEPVKIVGGDIERGLVDVDPCDGLADPYEDVPFSSLVADGGAQEIDAAIRKANMEKDGSAGLREALTLAITALNNIGSFDTGIPDPAGAYRGRNLTSYQLIPKLERALKEHAEKGGAR